MALRVGEESLNPQFLDDLEEYQFDGFDGRRGKPISTIFWTAMEDISVRWF